MLLALISWRWIQSTVRPNLHNYFAPQSFSWIFSKDRWVRERKQNPRDINVRWRKGWGRGWEALCARSRARRCARSADLWRINKTSVGRLLGLFKGSQSNNAILRTTRCENPMGFWGIFSILVLRGRDAFGQHQKSRPLAGSNTGSLQFTGSLSSLTDFILVSRSRDHLASTKDWDLWYSFCICIQSDLWDQDNESINRGLPVLEPVRDLNPWCWPEG